MSHAQRLRALLAGQPFIAPGCYDAFTALLIEQAGFTCAYVSGASIAFSRLGRPDIGLTTLTEVAETVGNIRDRVGLPLIVDGDNGFGNALNVQRTVQLLEKMGASAIQLEDQTLPKRCGHLDGKTLVSVGEMLGKLKAAQDARRDPATVIVARTDALAVEGFDIVKVAADPTARPVANRDARLADLGHGLREETPVDPPGEFGVAVDLFEGLLQALVEILRLDRPACQAGMQVPDPQERLELRDQMIGRHRLPQGDVGAGVQAGDGRDVVADQPDHRHVLFAQFDPPAPAQRLGGVEVFAGHLEDQRLGPAHLGKINARKPGHADLKPGRLQRRPQSGRMRFPDQHDS